MARKIITTITPYDYRDLKQEYSEKNIINQTCGTEFIIDVASTKTIEDINQKSQEINITPLGGGDRITGFGYSEVEVRGIFVKQVIQGRDEYYRTNGTFSIETDEIITDVNNVSVDTTLYYDKYYENADYVTSANMGSINSVYKPMMKDSNKQNKDGYLTASEALPYEHSVVTGRRIAFVDWWNASFDVTGSFPKNTISVKCQKLTNDHFKITINYSVVTWWGKNNTKADKWAQRENNATLWAVKKIGFRISANTVESREIEFDYKRDEDIDFGNAIGKNYEIESNEFLQTDENQSFDTRRSYALSKEIFDKFDQDRTIITFTLLNCEKYLIDGNYRYLRAEDLIYIQGENEELLGDEINSNGEMVTGVFEIIKTRPIWDGTFSMEVACRKVDMTP